jgi:hypothetical protein
MDNFEWNKGYMLKYGMVRQAGGGGGRGCLMQALSPPCAQRSLPDPEGH